MMQYEAIWISLALKISRDFYKTSENLKTTMFGSSVSVSRQNMF